MVAGAPENMVHFEAWDLLRVLALVYNHLISFLVGGSPLSDLLIAISFVHQAAPGAESSTGNSPYEYHTRQPADVLEVQVVLCGIQPLLASAEPQGVD